MKDDIKQFRSICRKHNMTEEQEYEFSDYIHDLKDSGQGDSGKNGDFTFKELDALAAGFLGEENERHQS